ncbi:MAG: LacI family DNA-binding transcriptional regulator [Halanaerobiaceae bacterium]
MANINDIARKAGVSKTTVSRVLNDYKDVSEETKQKVIKVMKSNNYRPSTLARSLATNKTYTIGLFGAPNPNTLYSGRVHLNDSFFREVIYGMEVTLGKKGYDIMYFSERSEKKLLSYKNIAADRHVDGVVFLGNMEKTSEIDEMLESDIPTVFVDSPISGSKAAYVHSDNDLGGQLVGEYLVNMGHKRIGFIMPKTDRYPANKRLKGFADKLEEYNYKFSPEWVVEARYTKQSGYQAMKSIMNSSLDITAVFCQDEIAVGAIKAIKEAGYSLPEDFSIVGFDDLQISEFIFPALTTVRQFKFEMGKAAAESLLKIINEDEDYFPSPVKLPVELIERDSCKKIN